MAIASRPRTAIRLRYAAICSGDLDAIVLTALEKEPARRYRSVAELSADIGRYLDGTRVGARNLSRRYRRLAPPRAPRRGGAAGARRVRRALRTPLPEGRARALTVRPSVAVLGFENLSHDASAEWLSTALTEMLSTELAAGGRLRTVPGRAGIARQAGAGAPECADIHRAHARAPARQPECRLRRARLIPRPGRRGGTAGEARSSPAGHQKRRGGRLGVGDPGGTAACGSRQQCRRPAAPPARSRRGGVRRLRFDSRLRPRRRRSRAQLLRRAGAPAHLRYPGGTRPAPQRGHRGARARAFARRAGGGIEPARLRRGGARRSQEGAGPLGRPEARGSPLDRRPLSRNHARVGQGRRDVPGAARRIPGQPRVRPAAGRGADPGGPGRAGACDHRRGCARCPRRLAIRGSTWRKRRRPWRLRI